MKLKNFVEELRWRGMIHDVMPDTEMHLMDQMRSAYIGFDPTADSLHIGNLVPIMLLFLQDFFLVRTLSNVDSAAR